MIREKYISRYSENAVKIVQTRVSSLRKKEILKTALRLYEDEKLGVAGALGTYEEKELESMARESLKLGISYPGGPTEGVIREEFVNGELESESELLEASESILESLRRDQPDFTFSHIFKSGQLETSLENELGLSLRSTNKFLSLSLIIKAKDSPNIMDALTGYAGRRYDKKNFLALTNMICEAYSNKIEDFQDGIYPVAFAAEDPSYYSKFYQALHGALFATGGSLFSGKLGQKIFSERFTLNQSRRSASGFLGAFFDSEGTVNEGDLYPLIENGVLRAPYTDKKIAALYSLPLTGSAGGEYDGLPEIEPPKLEIEESEKTARELLGGEKGVFVLIASGGDFTPDGHYSSPAQLAFLYDGERFVGRLPELNLSSHLYDMFGEDFLGVSRDDLLGLENSKVALLRLRVEKIL